MVSGHGDSLIIRTFGSQSGACNNGSTRSSRVRDSTEIMGCNLPNGQKRGKNEEEMAIMIHGHPCAFVLS